MLDEAKLTRDRAATFVKRRHSAKADLDSADAALKVAESRYQDALEEVRNRQAVLEQRRSELELAGRRCATRPSPRRSTAWCASATSPSASTSPPARRS